MKQTAVEWLERELNQKGKLTPVDFYQAKAMEKEQIIDAHKEGYWEGDMFLGNHEEYYNQTYKNK